jgi:hypothetical protein
MPNCEGNRSRDVRQTDPNEWSGLSLNRDNAGSRWTGRPRKAFRTVEGEFK